MSKFAFYYFYSSQVPESVKFAEELKKSPFGDVIMPVSTDNSMIRNLLLFGKYPQATIPFFMIQNNDQATFYQMKDIAKVLGLARRLVKQMPDYDNCDSDSSEVTIDGLRAVSDGHRVSLYSEENSRTIPSILQVSK